MLLAAETAVCCAKIRNAKMLSNNALTWKKQMLVLFKYFQKQGLRRYSDFRHRIKWQVFKNNWGGALLGIVILNLEFLTWIIKDRRTWI